MPRFALSILLGLLAGVWEVAARPFLASAFSLRPLLALVVLLLVASGRPRALATAAAGGIVLDLFSVGTFDLATIRWIALVIFLDILARHFLTNRSLYTAAALAAVGRIVERASSWFMGELAVWLGRSSYGGQAFESFWYAIVWDIALVAAGFVIIAFFTRRFLTFVPRAGSALPRWYEQI